MELEHISPAHKQNDRLFIRGAMTQQMKSKAVPPQPTRKPHAFCVAIKLVGLLPSFVLILSTIEKDTAVWHNFKDQFRNRYSHAP